MPAEAARAATPIDNYGAISHIPLCIRDRSGTSRIGRSVAEQRLDYGAGLVADVWSDGTEAMDEPVAVDRPNQLALDVAGGVETGLDAGLNLDMQREATPYRGERNDYDERKPGTERVGGTKDQCWAVRGRLTGIGIAEINEPQIIN